MNRHLTRALLALGALALLSGCMQSGLLKRHGDPDPIHTDARVGAKVADADNTVLNIPLHAYRQSLACFDEEFSEVVAGYKPPAEKPQNCQQGDEASRREAYVNNGIALVDTYCTRWFAELNQLQRNFQYQVGNYNIIKDLGTALIGVGRLHSDFTTAYGAIGVAGDAWTENVNELLFLAPNPAIVQQRVREAMLDRASQLKSGPAKPGSFVEAYAALEQYADMCTFYAAKLITDEAMSNSTAESEERTGNIQVKPTEEAANRTITSTTRELAPRRKILQAAIDGLSDATINALTAAELPIAAPADLNAGEFPASVNGRKQYLKIWVTRVGANAANLQTMETWVSGLLN